jgi:hypothetical protein
VCCVLTAYTITHWSIWPITILLRAGAFGVYIVALTTPCPQHHLSLTAQYV